MTFKTVQHKMREQKGASLAMALFLLIVVIVVSLLIINSALSNIGRTKRNIAREQDYLTESSAVQLVKEWLSGVEMTYEKEENEDTGAVSYNGSYRDGLDGVISDDKNLFRDLLWDSFEASVKGTARNADPVTYTIKADDMTDVTVRMTIDKPNFKDNSSGSASSDDGTSYITVDFSLSKTAGDKDNYYINMKIPCLCTAETESNDITEGSGTSATTQTVVTTTYKLTTPSGTSDDNRIEIKKGSAIN